MISITVPYKDFDEVDQVATCWFHLSKARLIEWIATEGGGDELVKKLTALGNSQDGALIIKTFSEIVGRAYGKRVEGDASKFLQSPEISAEFMDSIVWDALLTKLLTDEATATKLIAGCFPKDLMAQLQADPSAPQLPFPDQPATPPVKWSLERAQELSGLDRPLDVHGEPLPWAFREPTPDEQQSMERDQLIDCMKRKTSGWQPKSL
jgi:hypothetical protein